MRRHAASYGEIDTSDGEKSEQYRHEYGIRRPTVGNSFKGPPATTSSSAAFQYPMIPRATPVAANQQQHLAPLWSAARHKTVAVPRYPDSQSGLRFEPALAAWPHLPIAVQPLMFPIPGSTVYGCHDQHRMQTMQTQTAGREYQPGRFVDSDQGEYQQPRRRGIFPGLGQATASCSALSSMQSRQPSAYGHQHIDFSQNYAQLPWFMMENGGTCCQPQPLSLDFMYREPNWNEMRGLDSSSPSYAGIPLAYHRSSLRHDVLLFQQKAPPIANSNSAWHMMTNQAFDVSRTPHRERQDARSLVASSQMQYDPSGTSMVGAPRTIGPRQTSSFPAAPSAMPRKSLGSTRFDGDRQSERGEKKVKVPHSPMAGENRLSITFESLGTPGESTQHFGTKGYIIPDGYTKHWSPITIHGFPDAASLIPQPLTVERPLTIQPSSAQKSEVSRALTRLSEPNEPLKKQKKVDDKEGDNDKINGRQRLAVEFISFGVVTLPVQTVGSERCIIPDGLSGKHAYLGQKWQFQITYFREPFSDVVLLVFEIRSSDSSSVTRVTETLQQAITRQKGGVTICNEVMRKAFKRRIEELTATMTEKQPHDVHDGNIRTLVSHLASHDGLLFFGLRHLVQLHQLETVQSLRGFAARSRRDSNHGIEGGA